MDEALETKYWLERMDSSEAKQHSQLPPKLLPSLTPKFESIELVSALRHTNIPGKFKSHRLIGLFYITITIFSKFFYVKQLSRY